MEFSIGANCSEQSCKLLDFLPFVCDGCRLKYCMDHRSYAAHRCGAEKPVTCPRCRTALSGGLLLEVHLARDCGVVSAPAPPRPYGTYRCSKRGCSVVELSDIRCAACRKQFCLKHRFESDHDCAGKRGKQPASPVVASKSVVVPVQAAPSAVVAVQASSPSGSTDARATKTTLLLLRLTDGAVLRQTFAVSDTLTSVRDFLDANRTDPPVPFTLRSTFPPRQYSLADCERTLQELDLFPSGTLVMQAVPGSTPEPESPLPSLLSRLNPFKFFR